MRALISALVGAVISMTGLDSARAFEELDAKLSLPPMAKPSAKPVGYRWIGLRNAKEDQIVVKTAENGGFDTFQNSSGCTWSRPLGELFSPSAKWSGCGGANGEQSLKITGKVWPLEVGKTWSVERNGINDRGNTWNNEWKCKVAAQVRMVPAVIDINRWY